MNLVADIVVVWISILLEALPFVFLGAAVSGTIEEFVPASSLERWLFRPGWKGIIGSTLAGLFVPVCDCAVFPVVRRLLSKGSPPAQAAAYLCASASLGPSVLAATWWAFPGNPRMVVARAVVGIAAGLGSGALVESVWRNRRVLRAGRTAEAPCACGHDHAACGAEHGRYDGIRQHFIGRRLAGLCVRTSEELCENMLWIVLGGLFAAVIQVVLPHRILFELSDRPVLAVAATMGLGFCLCLCANADAFVARTFSGILPPGAVLAFMAFGGILDAKNLAMWLHGFRLRFVLLLGSFLAVLVFVLCVSIPGWWLE